MLFPLESRDGGETDVFPTRIHPDPNRNLYQNLEWPLTDEGYLDSKLRLNGESFQLVRGYMENHLDRELLPLYRDVKIDGDSFDVYGDNVFRYSDLQHMLAEIRNAARDLSLGRESARIRQMIPYHILSSCGGYDKGKEDLLDEFRMEIADYMRRFCDAIQAVMENAPEYELLNFEGP